MLLVHILTCSTDGNNIQWRGISERLPQVTFDFILRRQVELLEQITRNIDTGSRIDVLKRVGTRFIVLVLGIVLKIGGCAGVVSVGLIHDLARV